MKFGFFLKIGEGPFGPLVAKYFIPPNGFVSRLDECINADFGADIKFIGVSFFVKTFSYIGGPDKAGKVRYSRAKKEFNVDYPIDGLKFKDLGELERRQLIVAAWRFALIRAKQYSEEKSLDVNVESLLEEFEKCASKWIEENSNHS